MAPHIHIPGLDRLVHRVWASWVHKGRRRVARPLAAGADWVLRYTFRYRATCTLAWLACTLLGLVWAYTFPSQLLEDDFPGESWILTGGLVVLWLFFTAVFAAALVERVTVTGETLERRSWRGRQRLTWSLVDSFQIDRANATLTLGQRAGSRIQVSLFLDGLESLLPYLESRLNPTIPASIRTCWVHCLREQVLPAVHQDGLPEHP